MGVGAAALVDAGSARGDMWTTAEALAGAVKAQGDVDLVLTGRQSVDENSGAVFAGIACKLGWPLVTNVVKIVEIDGGQLTAERSVDGVQETMQVKLPAVLSVNKEINEPRYPSFMGIRKASKATFPVTPVADLGVNSSAARTSWTNIRKPDDRKTDVRIIEGATPQEQAAKLVDALLADKVL